MRVLRVRRGFTTNSSGANEYLSPSKGRDWGPRGRPDSGPTVPAYPYPVNLDAGASVQQPAPPASSHGSSGGAYVIGALALCALLLFVVERIVGFGLRKKKPPDELDPE
jgi:hypothetical protein